MYRAPINVSYYSVIIFRPTLQVSSIPRAICTTLLKSDLQSEPITVRGKNVGKPLCCIPENAIDDIASSLVTQLNFCIMA